MIIGIDVSRLSCPSPTGVERYSVEILKALPEFIPVNCSVVLYAKEEIKLDFELPKNWSIKILSWPPKRLWTQLRLAFELFWHKPDVLFVPAHVPPFFVPCRVVLTVHDIASEFVPGAYSIFEKYYARLILKKSIRKNYNLVVPSRKTQEGIIGFAKKYNLPNPQIILAPLGISAVVENHGSVSHAPFLLCVGRVEKKKNTHLVVQSFAKMIADNPQMPHKLILAGKPGFGYNEILQIINASPVKDRIEMLGWVSDEILNNLYTNASLTVVFGAYEGFGFPVLESLVRGTPVLSGRGGSLLEFGHLPVNFTDPENVEQSALDMFEILQKNKENILAKELIQKIKEEYSWARTASLVAPLLCKKI